MDDCIFCDKELVLEDRLGETDNFFVRVGKGLLAPGHVMIITKDHYPCYGDLPDELDEELEELKERVRNKVEEEFSQPFLAEYTPLWGQSVQHAHIHLVPSEGPDYNIDSIMEEMVIPGGIEYEETDTAGLKEIYREERMYVSIEEKGNLYVCHVKEIPFDRDKPHPHLHLRQFFTQTMGLEGVSSWQKMSEEDKIRDEEKRALTKEKLNGL